MEKSIRIKRIIIITIVSVLTVITILGITFAWISRHQYELSMQVEDTNGDDKTPVYITDELIKKHFEDYRIIRRNVSSKKDNEVRISGKFEDCDRSYIKTKTGMLTGIYVCNAYKGVDKNVTYKFMSSIKSGNFRMVITDEECNILYDIPIDQEYELTFFAENEKCYYVKFIGESAEIDVTIERVEENYD